MRSSSVSPHRVSDICLADLASKACIENIFLIASTHFDRERHSGPGPCDFVVAGAAMPTDIDALFDFAQTWLSVARSDPASASIVIHCGAGISRSAAAALLLLTLYFGNYLAAATHLFRTHPQVSPNALVCRLIFEKLGSGFGPDIFEALARGKGGAG